MEILSQENTTPLSTGNPFLDLQSKIQAQGRNFIEASRLIASGSAAPSAPYYPEVRDPREAEMENLWQGRMAYAKICSVIPPHQINLPGALPLGPCNESVYPDQGCIFGHAHVHTWTPEELAGYQQLMQRFDFVAKNAGQDGLGAPPEDIRAQESPQISDEELVAQYEKQLRAMGLDVTIQINTPQAGR